MAKQEEIRIGSGKSRHEKWLQLSITEKNLHILLDNLQEYNGIKYVKLNINILDNPDQYGKNVKATLDTWRPSGNYTPKNVTVAEEIKTLASDNATPSSDLPF